MTDKYFSSGTPESICIFSKRQIDTSFKVMEAALGSKRMTLLLLLKKLDINRLGL